MDDPRDKLRNSNNNLGINGKREKGIKFLSIISFSFFFFFFLRQKLIKCDDIDVQFI